MPSKEEISAIKAEAHELKAKVKQSSRKNLREAKILRSIVHKAHKQLTALDRKQAALEAKINRRLAILQGKLKA